MSAQELYAQGLQLLDACDKEAAEQLLEQAVQAALAEGITVQSLSFTLADLYQNLGKMELAIQMFRISIKEEPKRDTQKYMNLAQLESGVIAKILYELGIRCTQEQLDSVDPSSDLFRVMKRQIAQAYTAIAELYMTDLCDEPDAEQFCEINIQNAIHTDELCLDAYISQANLRLLRDRVPEAQEALRKVQIILPNIGEHFAPSSEVFGEIIRLLVEVEDYDGAVTVCRQSIQINEQQPDIVYIFAFSLYKIGELEAALETLDPVLKACKDGEVLESARELQEEIISNL